MKIPYFPNWQASGAIGPYLVTPNLMVVIPTSHDVRLSYGTTTVDWLGRAGTIAGIGVVALNVRAAPPPEASLLESTPGSAPDSGPLGVAGEPTASDEDELGREERSNPEGDSGEDGR